METWHGFGTFSADVVITTEIDDIRKRYFLFRNRWDFGINGCTNFVINKENGFENMYTKEIEVYRKKIIKKHVLFLVFENEEK